MIIITSIRSEDGYSPQWEFECPECGRIATFYSIAPKKCTNCLYTFNFSSHRLLKTEEGRINYHLDFSNEKSK